MVAQVIDFIESGMPGPAGAGITPSQLANLAELTGDTFTGAVILDMNSTGALIVRKADDTKVFVVDTTNSDVELHNGTDLRGYSDDNTTLTVLLSPATGTASFSSTITVGGRVIGDQSVWAYPIDGGGSTITTGIKPGFAIPYNGLITGWQIFGDTTGSIVVDLWKDTYANYPPVNADSMVTSQEPTISTSTKGQNLTVNSGNGWAVTKGDYVRPNVDSVTTLARAEIFLFVTRT